MNHIGESRVSITIDTIKILGLIGGIIYQNRIQNFFFMEQSYSLTFWLAFERLLPLLSLLLYRQDNFHLIRSYRKARGWKLRKI